MLLRKLLPFPGHTVPAGFPSPAEDFNTKRIDLIEQLITHPQATFLLRVAGPSMIEAGILDGDVVVVNRALRPAHMDIVVAVLDDNDFTVKYLHLRHGQIRLVAANPTYPDIVPRDGQSLTIWGVVTSSITVFKNLRTEGADRVRTRRWK